MGHDNKSPLSTANIKLEEQPTLPLSSPSINPLKRKTPPTDDHAPSVANLNSAAAVVVIDDAVDSADEQDDLQDDEPPHRSSPPHPSEYETGRVVCPSCGKEISFRDQATGTFSVELWNQHKEHCVGHSQLPNGNGGSPPARLTQQQQQQQQQQQHHHQHHQHHRHPRPPMSPTIKVYPPSRSSVHDFSASLANPPTKRRRAKRTEEERIAYLRADRYVAQFEAYRVLCASCDKWIRLRPNSTYCSIPWDAHRKSCLSKKVSNKNTYALDERNSLFSKDPDVRKFDAERVLCAVCDQWLPIDAEDHLQAVQKWLSHRGDCSKRAVGAVLAGVGMPGLNSPLFHDPRPNGPTTSGEPMSGRFHTRPSSPPPPPPRRDMDPYHRQDPPHPPYIPTSPHEARHPFLRKAELESRERKEDQDDGDTDADADAEGDPESDVEPDPTRIDLPPQTHVPPPNETETENLVVVTTQHSGSLDSSGTSPEGGSQSEHAIYSPAAGIFPPGPAHESRRRNAEQRAATLRADPLIKNVEPNRVFCSLCEKWVQLRQDSSYCAYPWYQHRGKCLARYERRAQKAAEIEEIKKRRAMGARNMHPAGPPYGPLPPYPPRSQHPYHPSHHRHPSQHYPYPVPSHMHSPPGHAGRGQHHHHHPEEEEYGYGSASVSEDDDGMDVQFSYRGLSASGSGVSEAASRSTSVVGDTGSRPDRERDGDAEVYARERAASGEADVDAGAEGDVDNENRINGVSRVGSKVKSRSEDTKGDGERNGNGNGAEEVNHKHALSRNHSQSPMPGARSVGSRHRVAPPPHLQHPRSPVEMSRRSSQSQPVIHFPPHMQSGRQYHHHPHHSHPHPPPPPPMAGNGGPSLYRSSPQQREREYVETRDRSQSIGNHHHLSSQGMAIQRERTVHRVHRGGQSGRLNGLGPYGGGVLPSSSGLTSSGRSVSADLDSPAGRKHFVSHSIAYLFQTTYDCSPCSSDELSISAFVAYLNAAMPMDKHEDFDTAEVVKCVGALRKRGRVLLEGDVIRKVRRE